MLGFDALGRLALGEVPSSVVNAPFGPKNRIDPRASRIRGCPAFVSTSKNFNLDTLPFNQFKWPATVRIANRSYLPSNNIPLLDYQSTPFSQTNWARPYGIRSTAPNASTGFSLVNSGASITLTGDTGFYLVNGVASTLNRGIVIQANQGIYTVNGIAAALNKALAIAAGQGTYVISGQAVTLNRGINIAAAQGAYVLNGIAANLNKTLSMSAAKGTYVLNGIAANLLRGIQMSAVKGTYTLTGVSVNNPKTLSINGAQGVYTVTGLPVVLLYSPINAPAQTHFLPFFVTVGPLTAR